MALFKRPDEQELTPRKLLERRYAVARRDIMILLVFTLFNIFLLLTKSTLFFLFSAHIPYVLVESGMLMCGMLPEEIYATIYEEPYHTIEFMDKGLLYIMVILASVVLVWYLISWLRTKKKVSAGWLIFTLIYVLIDTVAMVAIPGKFSAGIFDYVFHGWLICSLLSGILAVGKLRNLPEEPQLTELTEE